MSQEIQITVTLPDEQTAMALAQFVKRVGWQEWRQNAKHDNEAYLMKAAFYRLQKGLEEAGFAPR